MEELINRVKYIIDLCWESFSAKVGGGLIDINKEASMQLNLAYLLKNSVDLAIHHNDEQVWIELETGVRVNERMRSCDIMVAMTKGEETKYYPIELKCYKYLASSGGKRGAVDIFFKDVYADLELLESYAQKPNYIPGIQLTMTDHRNLSFPAKKNAKYFRYDISDGTSISGGIHLTTPIGGQDVNIKLDGTYSFNWKQVGEYYFLKLEDNII